MKGALRYRHILNNPTNADKAAKIFQYGIRFITTVMMKHFAIMNKIAILLFNFSTIFWFLRKVVRFLKHKNVYNRLKASLRQIQIYKGNALHIFYHKTKVFAEISLFLYLLNNHLIFFNLFHPIIRPEYFYVPKFLNNFIKLCKLTGDLICLCIRIKRGMNKTRKQAALRFFMILFDCLVS